MSADRDEFVVFGPNGFGAAIKEFRHRRGLTRQQLADEAEIYRSCLAKSETGATTEAIEQVTSALVALDLEIVVRERRPTSPRCTCGWTLLALFSRERRGGPPDLRPERPGKRHPAGTDPTPSSAQQADDGAVSVEGRERAVNGDAVQERRRHGGRVRQRTGGADTEARLAHLFDKGLSLVLDHWAGLTPAGDRELAVTTP